ncbi:MAG: ArsR/SmtB family transcription factor [Halanaeroarchaeum sp.]
MSLTESPPRTLPGRESESRPTPTATEVLDLFTDEYATEILAAVTDEPKPARELVDRCSGSRPTVYRRLQALEDAGVLDATTVPHPDGHHRKEFAPAIAHVTVDLREGEFTVSTVDEA